MTGDDLAGRLIQVAETTERGEWQRHAAAHTARYALDGRTGNERWGTKSGFPVLYLGRPPRDSVVMRAGRTDLVEPEHPSRRDSLPHVLSGTGTTLLR